MCQTATLPTLASSNLHPRRPAYQIVLPAIYDHTTLAVNIKNKHMGRTEGVEAGEEEHVQVMFHELFLLVPRCKNLGMSHVFQLSSKGSSSPLSQDSELKEEAFTYLHSLPSCP